MVFNALDETSGADGSSWCLHTNRGFTQVNICFWSPKYKTEERGLIGLSNLGTALWEFSEMEKEYGELY